MCVPPEAPPTAAAAAAADAVRDRPSEHINVALCVTKVLDKKIWWDICSDMVVCGARHVILYVPGRAFFWVMRAGIVYICVLR